MNRQRQKKQWCDSNSSLAHPKPRSNSLKLNEKQKNQVKKKKESEQTYRDREKEKKTELIDTQNKQIKVYPPKIPLPPLAKKKRKRKDQTRGRWKSAKQPLWSSGREWVESEIKQRQEEKREDIMVAHAPPSCARIVEQAVALVGSRYTRKSISTLCTVSYGRWQRPRTEARSPRGSPSRRSFLETYAPILHPEVL